jgi:hypothetical protein
MEAVGFSYMLLNVLTDCPVSHPRRQYSKPSVCRAEILEISHKPQTHDARSSGS